jgi:phosphate starvation-inducible PhoH-like protein
LELTIKVPTGSSRVGIVGERDRNLKIIRDALNVRLMSRDGKIVIAGEEHEVSAARRVFQALSDAAHREEPLNRQQVLDLIAEQTAEAGRLRKGWRADDADLRQDVRHDRTERPGKGIRHFQDEHVDEYVDDEPWEERLNVYVAGKPVRPRTPNQLTYLSCIRQFDLVFGLGPAGTGKTYLAVAAAVHLLRSGRVKRVVLTRPAVEAGEKLGYLPGDLRDKVNPYLRPLFDALHDMMDFGTARRFMENDVVEVVPLAFMRGRTLNHAAIILDEAQNCTKGQMKMFLTRMGQGSKMIVTGDPTQTDLPENMDSGLLDAAHRLAKTQGVAFVGFEQEDIVRHELVKRIIRAYDDVEEAKPSRSARARREKGANPGEQSENAPSDSLVDPMKG